MALDVPVPAREALASWRDELVVERQELRVVPADRLHVTLAFLGSQAEADAERIATAAFDAVAELPGAWLTPAAVRALPPQRPRLFALELLDAGGHAGALQAAVAAALVKGGFYRSEQRPFWPHLTLARVKRGVRAKPLPERPIPLADGFEANALTLYRSILRPQGSLYEPLARGSTA